MDELIAWAQIPIPSSVFAGQTHEEWFPLSGKQGEGQEGAINLVLSYSVSNDYYFCNFFDIKVQNIHFCFFFFL